MRYKYYGFLILIEVFIIGSFIISKLYYLWVILVIQIIIGCLIDYYNIKLYQIELKGNFKSVRSDMSWNISKFDADQTSSNSEFMTS